MSDKNMWGADPEKYRKLAKPYTDKDLMAANAKAFMAAVAEAREKYGIPEVCLQFDAYLTVDGQTRIYSGGAGWGDQNKQANLAFRMFQTEFAYLNEVLTVLAARMPKVRQNLITDPNPITETLDLGADESEASK